jgi:creatinine amidohydrolase
LPHLPAAQPVLFLPTQSVGFSPEHTRFAGTLTLKAETVIRLWTELAESVAQTGVKKLVLLNSHGGQVGLLDVVARDLRARLGMLVYSVNWFNLPLTGEDGKPVNDLFSAEEHRFGIHAGEIETSMMLALKPEQVDMAKAQNFHSTSQDRAAKVQHLGRRPQRQAGLADAGLQPAGRGGQRGRRYSRQRPRPAGLRAQPGAVAGANRPAAGRYAER